MNRKVLFFGALQLFLTKSDNSTCSSCLKSDSEKIFCADNSECLTVNGNVTCNTPINVEFNCPTFPRVPYNDTFMRKSFFVLATATQSSDPQICFDNQLPSVTLYQVRRVLCSAHYSDVECLAYTAFDSANKAIILSFRGTRGDHQYEEEKRNSGENGTIPFFNNGRVMQAYYDQFIYLWEGGVQQDLQHLINTYPDYELWVTGHSLGGALTTLASAYITTTGLFAGDKMKVVALATPSVGDLEFAKYHWETFPFSFHIVHRNDPIPKNSVVDTVHNISLYHQRTTVWYDNYMNPGDPYIICPEADGPYCNAKANQSGGFDMDHQYYFNTQLTFWGNDGCPDNQTVYQQPH